MNEPFRLRYTNQIVGAFLLVVLSFLILVSVLLMRAGNYFTEPHSFWIEMDQQEVEDLHRGAEVMILGQRAGQVDDIRYVDGSDKIRINLSIDPDKSDEIFEDSIVQLQRKFGVGTPMLVIRRPSGLTHASPMSPGNRIGNFQAENDRLEQMSREVESVSRSVRLIQQKLDPTLTSVDSAADRFSTTLDDTVDPAFAKTGQAFDSFYQTNEAIRPEAVETLRTVKAATESLDRRVGALTEKIETLVENDMRKTLGDVQESTDDVSDAAKSVSRVSQEVNQDIADTLVTLRDAAEQVNQLAKETRDLVRVVRQEADDLPGTTARINDTVDDTQDLVGEIRSHWLLRRYSRQSTSTPPLSPAGLRGGSVPGGGL